MNEPQTTLAIFDFDGTLTTGHLWVGIAAHHRKYKMKRLVLYGYLFSHIPLWLASKAKLVSGERNKKKWGEDIATLFKGLTPEQGRKVFEWVMDHYFFPKMRPDILMKLRDHQGRGHKITILSGMLADFLEVLRTRLNVDYVVGTKQEIKGEKYSGRILQPLCFGENKAKLLAEFIRERKLNVDFKDSWAYADSIYDAPVLEMVGNPIATYPDKNLQRLALYRKWPIIVDKSRDDAPMN